MDNTKDDRYYLSKIITDLEFIIRNMDGRDYDDFLDNEILQDSMMFRLVQISENAKKVSDEFKNGHNDVPWTDIYGLRNRIVHEYGNVDLHIVYETLVYDIPEVLDMLKN